MHGALLDGSLRNCVSDIYYTNVVIYARGLAEYYAFHSFYALLQNYPERPRTEQGPRSTQTLSFFVWLKQCILWARVCRDVTGLSHRG